MLIIDNKIIDEHLLNDYFVCNLQACKGNCCVAGDEGAPLAASEMPILDDIYPIVAPYLTEAGRAAIAEQGKYVPTEGGGYATPLMNGAACAYTIFDEAGIAQCGIQAAYKAGELDFPKPISCHLYPIRVHRHGLWEALDMSYWDICKPACKLGKQLGVAVYQFLQEPIVRQYGQAFYDQLHEAATHLRANKKKNSDNSDNK